MVDTLVSAELLKIPRVLATVGVYHILPVDLDSRFPLDYKRQQKLYPGNDYNAQNNKDSTPWCFPEYL